jgi:hypothetical protein
MLPMLPKGQFQPSQRMPPTSIFGLFFFLPALLMVVEI